MLTWPLTSFQPFDGVDGSWIGGLYVALESGMQFGREFVFTYGPLGFLHYPIVIDESLFLVSFVFWIAVHFIVIASLLWTARRALPLPLALVVCYVAFASGGLISSLPLVAFLWAWAALAPEPPRFAPRLLVYGGGGAAAIELLSKINFGFTILAVCLFTLAILPGRRRNLPLFGAVFAGSAVVLWLLTGQAIGNLPVYLSNALQIVAGYSQAMGLDVDPKSGEVGIALATIGVLLVAALLVTRGERRSLRWGSVALLLLFFFLCFKQDFVRRGGGGREDFAMVAIAVALAVAARRPLSFSLARCLPAAALVAPMFTLLVLASPARNFLDLLEPQTHAALLSDSIELLTDPSVRQSDREGSRTGQRATYDVSPAILDRIGDRTVAIEPWEISVAWAYGLNWKPLPVIQDYATYTRSLDQLNEAALEGRSGPETILRRNLRGTEASAVDRVDARYPAWDGPGAKLALLCNYGEVATAGEWQLLEKTADRCGSIGSLGTVAAATGEEIEVPAAPQSDEIVFARVHGLEPDLVEEIETLAYRRPDIWVNFNGGRRWNVAAPTAEDGLILSAPAAVDYRRPFQLAPNPAELEFGIEGAEHRPIAVSFYSRSVEPRRAEGSPRAAISG